MNAVTTVQQGGIEMQVYSHTYSLIAHFRYRHRSLQGENIIEVHSSKGLPLQKGAGEW